MANNSTNRGYGLNFSNGFTYVNQDLSEVKNSDADIMDLNHEKMEKFLGTNIESSTPKEEDVHSYISSLNSSERKVYSNLLDENYSFNDIKEYIANMDNYEYPGGPGNLKFEKKNYSSDRGLSFNNQLGIRGNLTPQTDEINDNIIGGIIKYYEPKKRDDEGNKLLNFGKNVGGSSWNLGLSLADMGLNLGDTVGNMGKLIVGTINNLNGEGDKLDEYEDGAYKEFAKEADAIADGMWDVLKERYWGTDENGEPNDFYGGLVTLANSFYEDPAGMVSDVLSLISGGAGLARRGLTTAAKVSNKVNTVNKLNRLAGGAEKVRKYSNALDPINVNFHPINTISAISKGVGKGVQGLVNTKPGQLLKNTVKVASDITGVSDKLNKLRGLADTPLGKFILPEAEKIYEQIGPMSSDRIAKFERDFGVKYGDYLNEHGIVGTPRQMVDQLQNINDGLYKDISNGVKKIEEPLKVTGEDAEYLKDMLQFDLGHSAYVTSVSNPTTKKLNEIYLKFLSTGEIDASDLLFSKRYYERRAKFTYGKSSNFNPAQWERATNIDNAVREMLIKHAEKNGFVGMREMSKEIQKNRAIIDGMGYESMKGVNNPNGVLQLSDAILAAASYDSKVLSKMALRQLLNSDYAQRIKLKLGNAIRGVKQSPYTNIDMKNIEKINAENRARDWINDALKERLYLPESTQGGVVATDNMDFANMRYEDVLDYADRVKETYAHSPWDVEKKVVEWKTDADPKDFKQSDLFSSIVD